MAGVLDYLRNLLPRDEEQRLAAGAQLREGVSRNVVPAVVEGVRGAPQVANPIAPVSKAILDVARGYLGVSEQAAARPSTKAPQGFREGPGPTSQSKSEVDLPPQGVKTQPAKAVVKPGGARSLLRTQQPPVAAGASQVDVSDVDIPIVEPTYATAHTNAITTPAGNYIARVGNRLVAVPEGGVDTVYQASPGSSQEARLYDYLKRTGFGSQPGDQGPVGSVDVIRGLVGSTFNQATGVETVAQDTVNQQRLAQQNADIERAGASNAIVDLLQRSQGLTERPEAVAAQIADVGGKLTLAPLERELANLQAGTNLEQERIRQAGGVRQAQIQASRPRSENRLNEIKSKVLEEYLSPNTSAARKSELAPLVGAEKPASAEISPRDVSAEAQGLYPTDLAAMSDYTALRLSGIPRPRAMAVVQQKIEDRKTK